MMLLCPPGIGRTIILISPHTIKFSLKKDPDVPVPLWSFMDSLSSVKLKISFKLFLPHLSRSSVLYPRWEDFSNTFSWHLSCCMSTDFFNSQKSSYLKPTCKRGCWKTPDWTPVSPAVPGRQGENNASVIRESRNGVVISRWWQHGLSEPCAVRQHRPTTPRLYQPVSILNCTFHTVSSRRLQGWCVMEVMMRIQHPHPHERHKQRRRRTKQVQRQVNGAVFIRCFAREALLENLAGGKPQGCSGSTFHTCLGTFHIWFPIQGSVPKQEALARRGARQAWGEEHSSSAVCISVQLSATFSPNCCLTRRNETYFSPTWENLAMFQFSKLLRRHLPFAICSMPWVKLGQEDAAQWIAP